MDNLGNIIAIVFAIIIVPLVVVISIREYRSRRAVKALLASRRPLSSTELGSLFASASIRQAELAALVRGFLELRMKLSLAGLRPDDRFDEDLYWPLDRDPVLLVEIAEQYGFEVGIEAEDFEDFGRLLETIKTVRDLVAWIEQNEPKSRLEE